ncbi:MAG: hypothetical protein QNJ51_11805 [Calothrix sp. MO_167.B12]|nr:hypothetical protein [Calothrix sp. MO_167.B12]
MIKVYVWLPLGYAPSLDELYCQIFNKRKIESLFIGVRYEDIVDNFDDETFFQRATGMNNPIPIVREAMMQEIQRSCGHASLSVKLENGEEEYLSFWPKKDNIKKVIFRTEGKLLDNYETDKKDMGRGADEVIELSNLDENKVYDYICKCREEHKEKSYEYNLFFKNCSTIVASALEEGKPRNLLTKLQEFWSLRCKESIESAGVYGLILMGLYSMATGREVINEKYIVERVRASFIGGDSSTGVKMIKKHFSSTKSVFSVFEIGLQTPKSVLEYAEYIENL